MLKKPTATTEPKKDTKTFTGHDKIILFSTLGYLAVITAFMVWHGEFFSPDRFFVIVFLGMLLVGRAWLFLWDWLPPVMLILGYDYLRGLVPQIINKVHIHAMIDFDKFIFRVVPTLQLQKWLYHGTVTWYDDLAVIFYLLHFIVPLFVAFMFWVLDKKIFKQYMTAMVVVSYAAFITYYLFPAMPPWLAAQQGFLPPVAHIMDQVMGNFAHPVNLPTVYQYVGANLVAAVPSLHAAYPLMMALFVSKKWPGWGKLSFIYPVFMWFSVVYLGEHYVFDICVAIIYTLTIYALVTNWRNSRTKLKNFFIKIFRIKPKEQTVTVSCTSG